MHAWSDMQGRRSADGGIDEKKEDDPNNVCVVWICGNGNDADNGSDLHHPGKWVPHEPEEFEDLALLFFRQQISITAGEDLEIEYKVGGWYFVKKKEAGSDGKLSGLVPVSYVSAF
ncbi:hypothetical protein R1flu_009778 [Riccia fluitans]|uniref:SH3 domain-containing protein n=1 Tax=Riccia fluitans TaxID=41844 RepID=A0ABD1Z339_9MARC